MLCVHVVLTILEALQHAIPNAWLALIAHKIELASIKSAPILVLELAVRTLNVKLSITVPSVAVLLITLEILSFDASKKKVSSTSSYVCEKLILNCLFDSIERPILREPENPCIPSPCGPFSQCRDSNGQPVCSCVQNYIGRPPNCRPECMLNSECPSNLACVNERCKDPCPGSCGFNALCNVVNHSPVCHCMTGYTGDPFSGCSVVQSKSSI
jgi:hypothetical protein